MNEIECLGPFICVALFVTNEDPIT